MTGEHEEDLRPEEAELRGAWIFDGSRTRGDVVSQRIKWLVSSRLQRLGRDPSGWETLYCDPRDGRLWEHTYPQSEMHGGGPPALRFITPADAAAKYGVGTG